MRLLQVEKNLKYALEKVFVKLGFQNVVIQRMVISKDLKFVKIFVTQLLQEFDKNKNLKSAKLLNKNLFLINQELKKYISLKFFPDLTFFVDTHAERIDKMQEILREVKSEIDQFNEKKEINEIDNFDN